MQSRQISIGGKTVGIIDLDEIFTEIKASGVEGNNTLMQMIFDKVKVRNYIPTELEDVYKECLFDEYMVYTGQQKSRTTKSGAPEIRVYGQGCSRCEQLDRLVMEIIARKGLRIDYQYVKDIREMMKLGTVSPPVLTINGKLTLAGRVPSRHDLEKLLSKAFAELS